MLLEFAEDHEARDTGSSVVVSAARTLAAMVGVDAPEWVERLHPSGEPAHIPAEVQR